MAARANRAGLRGGGTGPVHSHRIGIGGQDGPSSVPAGAFRVRVHEPALQLIGVCAEFDGASRGVACCVHAAEECVGLREQGPACAIGGRLFQALLET